MTWVKICGITNLEDALTAVEAGADALGFVFYEKSPRKIDVGRASEIVAKLPERVEKIGVFVDEAEDPVCAIAEEVGLTGVQLHGGHEDPRVAEMIVDRRPRTKILIGISMMRDRPDGWAKTFSADRGFAFLLDTGGGTGRTFNWVKEQKTIQVIKHVGPIVVAGGLIPANVPDAIRILQPWGVDVASGVEARPGKKDPDKVRAFIAAVRHADKVH